MARVNAATAPMRSSTLQGLAHLLSTTRPAPKVRRVWQIRALVTGGVGLILAALAITASLQALDQRRRALDEATHDLDMLASALADHLDSHTPQSAATAAPSPNGVPSTSAFLRPAPLARFAQEHNHQILITDTHGDVTASLPVRSDVSGQLTDHLGPTQPLTIFAEGAGVMRITLPSGVDVLATVRNLHHPMGQVAVYQRVDDVLKAWRRNTLRSTILLICAAGLTVVGTWSWRRQSQRMQDAEAQSFCMREQMETALNRGRCGLWDWDIARGRIYWSTSMFDLLELQPEQQFLSVGDLNGMVHPDDQSFTDIADQMADTNTNTLDHTFRMRTGSGAWIWLRARAELVARATSTTRLIGIAVDVTDQHKLAERTAMADTRLRDAIETISEAFVLWDADNNLVMCNSKFQKFHSLPNSAVVTGTSYASLMARGAPPQIECEIGLGQTQILMPEEPLARSYEARLADGRWLQINERRTADGGFVSVGTDITNLKHNEEQLLESERRLLATVADLRHSRHALELQTKQLSELAEHYLEQKAEAETASRVKSQFLSNMSHELRTPLNHIIGFSELMEHQTLGALGHEKYIDYCSDIRQSGQKLLGLISDVLEMSELESGSSDVQRAWHTAQDVLQPVFESAHQKASEKQVVLRIVQPRPLPDLQVDASAIRKSLDKILDNAIKFSHPNGVIELMVLADAVSLSICIQDHGVGISMEDQKGLFKPFEQSRPMLEDGYKGPGLGLAIARSLIKLHGGTLHLTSAPGQGTRADIKLPLAESQTQKPALKASAAA